MAESTIEWTEQTWNPVTGCSRVSPGCAHCYAMTMAKRLKAMGNPRYQNDGGKGSGPGFGVTLHPDKLDEPLRRKKPTVYFVNSMSDLFHEEIPFGFVMSVFTTMVAAERHTFQVLTKRPERMRMMVWHLLKELGLSEVPRHIWLGTSIENRRFVARADEIRQIPALRFISAEPLLGPLIDADDGMPLTTSGEHRWPDGYEGAELTLNGIDWLIVGGESGGNHRPFDPAWARELRDYARHAGTAFFMKQTGGHHPGTTLDDLPQDLRVREYPK